MMSTLSVTANQRSFNKPFDCFSGNVLSEKTRLRSVKDTALEEEDASSAFSLASRPLVRLVLRDCSSPEAPRKAQNADQLLGSMSFESLPGVTSKGLFSTWKDGSLGLSGFRASGSLRRSEVDSTELADGVPT